MATPPRSNSFFPGTPHPSLRRGWVDDSFAGVLKAQGPSSRQGGSLQMEDVEEFSTESHGVTYDLLPRRTMPYRLNFISVEKARALLGIKKSDSITAAIQSRAPHILSESTSWAQEVLSFRGAYEENGPSFSHLHLTCLTLGNDQYRSLKVTLSLQESSVNGEVPLATKSTKIAQHEIWPVYVASNAAFRAKMIVENKVDGTRVSQATEMIFQVQEKRHGLYSFHVKKNLEVALEDVQISYASDSTPEKKGSPSCCSLQ